MSIGGEWPKKFTETCIVRLSTEQFFRGNKFCHLKSISYLKRKSNGSGSLVVDDLREEFYNTMPDHVHIENLDKFKDGIYQLVRTYDVYNEEISFTLMEIKHDENKPSLP